MELRPEIVSELWHSDLIESEDCGLEESQEFYRQVKEGRDLPPDVWQIGDTARFIRLDVYKRQVIRASLSSARASSETSKYFAILISFSSSGTETPLSHFCTDCLETPNSAANCS